MTDLEKEADLVSWKRHYHFALLGRRKQGRKPSQKCRRVVANSKPVKLSGLLAFLSAARPSTRRPPRCLAAQLASALRARRVATASLPNAGRDRAGLESWDLSPQGATFLWQLR